MTIEAERKHCWHTLLFPQALSAQNSALDKLLSGHFTDFRFSTRAVDSLISRLESTDTLLKVHSMWRYRLFSGREKMMELFL